MYKKIVLVDFSWLYNRYFFVAKQQVSDNLEETLFTMLFQFLKRVEASYERTKIFLVLDCALHTTENFRLNNNYKQNRDKEGKKEVYSFIKEIVKKLKSSLSENYSFVKAKEYEADQVIAYLVNKYHSLIPIVIYSGDKDLLQLTSYSNVYVSDKFEQGEFLIKTNREIFDKFKNSKGENFTRISEDKRDILKYRSLKGDPSDNLPAVFPRIKDSEIVDIIKNYWKTFEPLTMDEIEFMINSIKEKDTKLAEKLKAHKEDWLINYKIMNLQGLEGLNVISY